MTRWERVVPWLWMGMWLAVIVVVLGLLVAVTGVGLEPLAKLGEVVS